MMNTASTPTCQDRKTSTPVDQCMRKAVGRPTEGRIEQVDSSVEGKVAGTSFNESGLPHRRRFLQAAATAISVPYFVPSSVLSAPGRPGANDRLNIGVIGTGNRVRWLTTNWADPHQIRIVALADCSAKKNGQLHSREQALY